MMWLLEPLRKLIYNGESVAGEDVRERLFGGFCECGGLMYQKFWFSRSLEKILVSECEKCWKHRALVFNSTSFVLSADVKVVGRYELSAFLKEVLGEREVLALVKKARGEEFDPIAYTNAKKKLNAMNLEVEELIRLLQ